MQLEEWISQNFTRRFQFLLPSGTNPPICPLGELYTATGKKRAIVSRTLRLALLSPEIIHQALAGSLPVTAKALLSAGIPADWKEQKKVVGME